MTSTERHYLTSKKRTNGIIITFLEGISIHNNVDAALKLVGALVLSMDEK